MIFLNHQKEIILELKKVNVEFIIIGGYAVIFHGYLRTTGDVDIWLKPDNDNKEKLLTALIHSGFSIKTLDHIRQSDFTQPVSFHIGQPPERIDFLTILSGLNFDDALQRAELLKSGELLLPVLHLEDLIINKMLSGRAKDKADIEELQKIHNLTKKHKK